MEQVDIVVVGAGVVGLAVAERLSRRKLSVIVIERHETFGRETSSRNSEVVHAGLYYTPGSLKARLCVAGNRLLGEWCRDRGVGFARLGKLVPGNLPDEVEETHRLLAQGEASGAEGLRLLSASERSELEPSVRCEEAMLSPNSGIIDSHALMTSLERKASQRDVLFAYGCELIGFTRTDGPHVVEVGEPDGGVTRIAAERLVNAAGLWADHVAALAGIDVDAAGYRQMYSKGEYFSVASRHHGRVNHLNYPAVTARTLGGACHGVHLVIDLGGRMKLGPNELYGPQIETRVDPGHALAFHQEMSRFLPFLEIDDLAPEMAGVRPMLQRLGGPFCDFVIREESDRGLPGLVNLIGIESPGLTSCLAIAAYVDSLIR